MLRTDNRVYAVIDGAYHSNPGPNSEEIERCIDWLYDNGLHKEEIGKAVNVRLHARAQSVYSSASMDVTVPSIRHSVTCKNLSIFRLIRALA